MLMGTIAGIFGVGGGVILVPFLTFIFEGVGIEKNLVSKLAVATSMGCILFTSPSSIYGHYKKNGIDKNVLIKILPGLFVGAILGAFLVSYISGFFLKIIFIIFEFCIATWFLINKKVITHSEKISNLKIFLTGKFIGFFSTLLGIGGGVFSTSFLSWHNYSIQRAIGTSASIGFPLALFSVIGFIISGFSIKTLPEYSIGYIYIPALPGILITSIFFAKIGAGITHKLNEKLLKKIFAIFLFSLAFKMILSL